MESTPSGQNAKLRELALKAAPDQLGIKVPDTPHAVWGVVMETSFEEGEGGYTAVALVDGNASIYIGDHSGVIGGFAHPSVRTAALRAVTTAERYADQLRSAEILPLPAPGHTRFYLLTGAGRLASSEIGEEELGEGQHPLSPLFHAMHEVISELRVISESQ